jgi:nucleoid-associated protein YgaU
MSNQGPQKAMIKPKDGGAPLACRFNPREVSISKSATWQKTAARAAKTAPTPEFTGTQPRQLQMELFFDAWEAPSHDLTKDLDLLFGWTNPTEKSISNNQPNPPVVVFHWGTASYFDAYVKQVTAKYTMFASDGTPVRATASVTFEEVPNEPGRQNPTSGGPAGRRTHVVAAGDSLHSIAEREYGNPALWRGLAQANAIDDPLRLRPGTQLLIPSGREASELS